MSIAILPFQAMLNLPGFAATNDFGWDRVSPDPIPQVRKNGLPNISPSFLISLQNLYYPY